MQYREEEIPEIEGDDFLNEINFDTLFDNIGCDFSLFEDEFNVSPQSSIENPPVPEIHHQAPSPAGSSSASWVDEIEQMLMKEDDDDKLVYQNPNDQDLSLEYLSDFLADVPLVDDIRVLKSDVEEKQGNSSEINASVPVTVDVNESEQEEIRVLSDKNSTPNSDDDCEEDKEGNGDSSEGKNEDNDDPVSKKRKRQLRNRDAAVRSRERKKLYVRDLEMKSRYLEGECIRLQRLLQCCYAENHALHLQLQMGKTLVHGASKTKQESAVLMLESLLLGSLLWFLGVMGICLLLPLLQTILPVAMLAKVGRNNPKIVDLAKPRGVGNEKIMGLGTLRLFFKRKRWKATRSKMKAIFFFSAVVA